jgi:hypothetical protein
MSRQDHSSWLLACPTVVHKLMTAVLLLTDSIETYIMIYLDQKISNILGLCFFPPGGMLVRYKMFKFYGELTA